MIRTIIRLNSSNYEPNCIGIDSDISEVSLHENTDHLSKDRRLQQDDAQEHVDSWIFDELFDKQSRHEKRPQFASQYEVYNRFQNWFKASPSTLLYCITLGGRSTGKSYSLFGDNSSENQGLVPRFLHSLFAADSETVLIQVNMYLSYSDHFIDLLKPPTQYPYTNNIGYSPSLGVFLIPLNSILSTTLEHSLHIIHLGLVSASMISLNSPSDHFNSSHLVTTIRVVTSQRSYTMTFLELSSLIFYPTCLTESDRLSSSCVEINCTNSLAFCGLYGDAAKDDLNGFKHKSNQSTRSLLQLTGPHETSFLTYLLQDALSLRSPPQPPSSLSPLAAHKPATYLIGCLKSTSSSISEIKVTLDLIHSIAEKVHSVEREQRVDIQTQDSNEELLLPPSTVASQSPPPQFQSITDSIDELNNELEKASHLLEELEEEIKSLQESPHQSGSTFQTLMSHLVTLRSFHESKISYLVAFKDLLTRPYHFRNHSAHKAVEEITSIQKWLKSRGLLGLKYLTSGKEDKGGEENGDGRKKKSTSLPQEVNHEKDSHLNVPWCGPLASPSDPFLVPITSLDLSRHYLHIPIPPGHMAICQESLSPSTAEATVKFSFPGIKHCKVFKLNGHHIRPKHCILFRLGTTLKIRPLPNEDEEQVIVFVNGREISEETRLAHLDTITLGLDRMLIVHIPPVLEDEEEEREKVKDEKLPLEEIFSPSLVSSNILLSPSELATDSWFHCPVSGFQGELLSFISTHLMNINHYKHSAIDRQLIPILKIHELTDDMKLSQYAPPLSQVQEIIASLSSTHRITLVELLIAVKQINFLANELRRLVSYEVLLTKKRSAASASSAGVSRLRQWNGIEDGVLVGKEIYTLQIRCEVLDGNRKNNKGDSWIWSPMIFLHRYFQIQKMFVEFHEKCESNLEILDEAYPPPKDPFYDPSLPELIGVSTLHIDSLFHLIDTRDTLPIITFKGNHGGQLKLHVRIWIDKMETVPSYISVDKESKLTDFIGHTAILRFYFEYLFDIPPSLSHDLQIIFSFFGHTGQYRTTRAPVMNVITGDRHAYINSVIVIEQKITPDFVRYLQKKSIEFEIWGTRISNRQYVPASAMIGKLVRVGEPIRMKKRGGRKRNIESKAGEKDEEGAEEFENEEGEGDERNESNPEEEDDDDGHEEDPAELKNKLKEMAFQLEKAEKNMRRTTKAASTYRDELSRVNSKSVLKDQTLTSLANEKDAKIRELEAQLQQVKEEATQREQQRLLQLAAAQDKKNKSKVCAIS